MSEQRDILPPEYKAFNTLPEKARQQYESPIGSRYRDPELKYNQNLVLLCQAIDRSLQATLVGQLKDKMRDSGSILTGDKEKVRSIRDEAKTQYATDLSKGSIVNELISIRERESSAYIYGLQGGNYFQENEATGDLQPIVESLRSIDPRLANKGLLVEEFGSVDFALRNQNRTRIKAFENAGLSINSPEFQLVTLLSLEFRTCKHMMEPLYRGLRKFADENPIKFLDQTDGRGVNVYAARQLRNILEGNKSIDRRRYEEKNKNQWPEDFFGTEYFRGLNKLINSAYYDLLQKRFGEDTENADLVFRSIAFLRTSKKGNETVDFLLNPVITAIASGDIDAAIIEIMDLIESNPDLFHSFIAESFGYSEKDLDSIRTKNQAKKLLAKQDRIDERKRQQLRREQDRIAENELERDESLWPRIEQYIGKIAKVTGDYYQRSVRVTGKTSVKVRSGEGTKSGFVVINYLDEMIDPNTGEKKTVINAAVQTYGNFLKNVESGIFVYPEEQAS